MHSPYPTKISVNKTACDFLWIHKWCPSNQEDGVQFVPQQFRKLMAIRGKKKRQNQSTESYLAEMWPESINIKLQREMGLQLLWLADHHLGTLYLKSEEILRVRRNDIINQIVFPCSCGRSLLIILKSWSDDRCTHPSAELFHDINLGDQTSHLFT